MKLPPKLLEGGHGDGEVSGWAQDLLREGQREALSAKAKAAIWQGITTHAGPLAGAASSSGAGAASASAAKVLTGATLVKGTIATLVLAGGIVTGQHALRTRVDHTDKTSAVRHAQVTQGLAPEAGPTRPAAEKEWPAALPVAAPKEAVAPPAPTDAPSRSSHGKASAGDRSARGFRPTPASSTSHGRAKSPVSSAATPALAPSSTSTATATLASAPAPAAAVTPAPAPLPTPTAPATPAVPPLAVTAKPAAAAASAAPSNATPTPPSRLGEESQVVLDARQALRAGRYGAVLRGLEAARTRFPRGALVQEREALTIEALWRSGETTAARARARAFAVTYPGSPHAAHLTQLTSP